jgi:hypothetical protein
LPRWPSAAAQRWLARASVGLAASSSQAHLAQSLALAQARSEVPSVPRCGDEMFLAWFGVIVLACMIWVVLDV